MAHQVDIGPVVTGNIVYAVGEFLALGEKLFQVAEATGHRLAACVDDPGIRQHQVDKPDVTEIIGHLVDKAGLDGAVDPRLVEILLAQYP